ncbi:MAG: hypothetical protein ACM3QU_10085 [Verrucomicrobiota bacterium]
MGDGFQRPVVAQVEHEAEGGFVVDELVIGRHAAEVQDGATFSRFTIRYPSGVSGASLYETVDEAREAARQEMRGPGDDEPEGGES